MLSLEIICFYYWDVVFQITIKLYQVLQKTSTPTSIAYFDTFRCDHSATTKG